MRIQTLVLAAAVGIFVLTGGGAVSASDPENDIKYRKTTMSAIGAHMGAIVATVKGKAGTDAQLIAHAKGMAAMGPVMSGLFGAGTGEGDTETKPEIWSNSAEFATAVMNFENAAAVIGAAADSGNVDGVKAALGGLGKSCKGCHSTFRKEK